MTCGEQDKSGEKDSKSRDRLDKTLVMNELRSRGTGSGGWQRTMTLDEHASKLVGMIKR